MTKQQLAEVLGLLPKLSAGEREAVSARIKLLAVKRASRQGIDSLVCLALRGLTGGKFPHLKYLRESQNWYRFARGCEALDEFIKSQCGENLGRKRFGVVTLIVGLVLDDLKARGRGMGPVTVGDRLLHVDAVIEDAFPNYAECGILRDVLLGAVNGTHKPRPRVTPDSPPVRP